MYVLCVVKDGREVILKEAETKKEIDDFWECIKGCQRLAGYERKKEK